MQINLDPTQQSILIYGGIALGIIWGLWAWRDDWLGLFKRSQLEGSEAVLRNGRLFSDQELKQGGEAVTRRVREQFGAACDELELLSVEVDQLKDAIGNVNAEFNERCNGLANPASTRHLHHESVN